MIMTTNIKKTISIRARRAREIFLSGSGQVKGSQ